MYNRLHTIDGAISEYQKHNRHRSDLTDIKNVCNKIHKGNIGVENNEDRYICYFDKEVKK